MGNKCANVLFLFAASGAALAAGNPLSVHVLNIQNGLPSPDVAVTLQRHEGGNWVQLSEAFTNEQGRISALYPEGEALVDGTYRVVFETGDWFESQGTETFFPEIPVVFTMDAELDHYHVPLLLSPYGYSTYRGN
ncbi:MAG TPA: hydroxyisourate hydrolase [Marinobacter sp.]|nr:hydroxyisourate hydrolase [Marinobacter sp.]